MSAWSSSTHYSYFPGERAGPADHLLLEPFSSWRGHRGARPRFGAAAPGLAALELEISQHLDRTAELSGPERAELNFLFKHRDALLDRAWRIRDQFEDFVDLEEPGSADVMAEELEGLDQEIDNSVTSIARILRPRMTPTDWSNFKLMAARRDALRGHGSVGPSGFGRLYASAGQFTEPSDFSDAGAVLARSGWSGLRGGRPWYGAADDEEPTTEEELPRQTTEIAIRPKFPPPTPPPGMSTHDKVRAGLDVGWLAFAFAAALLGLEAVRRGTTVRVAAPGVELHVGPS